MAAKIADAQRMDFIEAGDADGAQGAAHNEAIEQGAVLVEAFQECDEGRIGEGDVKAEDVERSARIGEVERLVSETVGIEVELAGVRIGPEIAPLGWSP